MIALVSISVGTVVLMAVVCIALRHKFMAMGAEDALNDLAIEHNANPELIANRLEHRALILQINQIEKDTKTPAAHNAA